MTAEVLKRNMKNNLQLVKKSNLNLILKLIHERGSVSRAELKRITNMSPTTVSTLVDELIEKGLVKETGIIDTGTKGRKAVSVEINPSGRHFAGVEVEHEYLTLDVYDLEFSVVYHKRINIEENDDVIKHIISLLKDAKKENDINLYSVIVGVSGIIDISANKVLVSTVMNIEDIDFEGKIKEVFPNVDVILQNSSSLIAYAEKEERKISDLVTIDIGSGVGAGIIIDGNIYIGAGGTAGEFGHISINSAGVECKCGNRGCVERYTNTKLIRKKASEVLGKKVTLEEIKFLAENGNDEIKKILFETAENLSVAVVGLVNMLAPESVIITGSITKLGDAFLLPLQKAVNSKCRLRNTSIEFSDIKANPVTLGGAEFAFEKMINKL